MGESTEVMVMPPECVEGAAAAAPDTGTVGQGQLDALQAAADEASEALRTLQVHPYSLHFSLFLPSPRPYPVRGERLSFPAYPGPLTAVVIADACVIV